MNYVFMLSLALMRLEKYWMTSTPFVYQDKSMHVFSNESLSMVSTQPQASIYNWCCHFWAFSCLPHSFAAASWCHRCDLKMNLHLRHSHYDSAACSGWKPRGNLQYCVGCQVCLETRGIVLYKSPDVEGLQDAGSVFNTGGKQNGGLGGRRDIYSWVPAISWANLFCWLTNTKPPSLQLVQLWFTYWMEYLVMRFSTYGEECLRCRVCGDGFECGHYVGWFRVVRSWAACTLVLVYVSIRLSESQWV